MITQYINEAFPSAVCQPAKAHRVRMSSKLPQVYVIFNITETNHTNALKGRVAEATPGCLSITNNTMPTIQQTAERIPPEQSPMWMN